ncbi:MAG: NAD-dependent malic enzyme [Candidatus Peribacteraceae bacterium]|nr:NAD-dependent malic enzyme [Candidatus Peribacteraceae bacterium]
MITSEALAYHSGGERPGKIGIQSTKPLQTQRDLSLAYTPGVAEPVLVIAQHPEAAYDYTSKGNLVAVVTNGTAVLGLGNQGALASKPVMEGKAVLFKKFADIDAVDIEINETDPAKLADIIASLEPTFGGINLEDIKAPECFQVEEELIRRMRIPVFHDDQHGTAIVVAAGLTNALLIAGKELADASVVINGAGSAAIAIARFLTSSGLPKEHLTLCDTGGVIYRGRGANMNPYKEEFARDTSARTLADALEGADVFIGVSKADVLTAPMLQSMAPTPIVFALANPDPEIRRDLAVRTRPDAIIATGRSDYPNQVNNVLCFPFLFRGALDTRARSINHEMKVAASKAIAALARKEVPRMVLDAYRIEDLSFGPSYILPKPLDPRLRASVVPAVAQAAMESGVAQQSCDINDYRLRQRGIKR